MKDQGMEPQLKEFLLTHLEGWATDTPPTSNHTNLPFLEDQSQISWNRMLQLAILLLVQIPNTSLAMSKIAEIKCEVDICSHPKAMECLVGHVGSSQQ